MQKNKQEKKGQRMWLDGLESKELESDRVERMEA